MSFAFTVRGLCILWFAVWLCLARARVDFSFVFVTELVVAHRMSGNNRRPWSRVTDKRFAEVHASRSRNVASLSVRGRIQSDTYLKQRKGEPVVRSRLSRRASCAVFFMAMWETGWNTKHERASIVLWQLVSAWLLATSYRFRMMPRLTTTSSLNPINYSEYYSVHIGSRKTRRINEYLTFSPLKDSFLPRTRSSPQQINTDSSHLNYKRTRQSRFQPFAPETRTLALDFT